VAAPACLLVVAEPDLGTALVIAFTLVALMLAAGMPVRYLGFLLVIAAVGFCCSRSSSRTSGRD